MSSLVAATDIEQLQEEERYIALHYAASNGLLEELKLLLVAGTVINVQDQVTERGADTLYYHSD
jgi:ankyrin repeat protein